MIKKKKFNWKGAVALVLVKRKICRTNQYFLTILSLSHHSFSGGQQIPILTFIKKKKINKSDKLFES